MLKEKSSGSRTNEKGSQMFSELVLVSLDFKISAVVVLNID